MIVYYIFIIIITVLYATLILLFTYGWTRIKEFKGIDTKSAKLFISVIVATKNEEVNISNLLESLKKQSYSKKQYEIILINDHSTDRTLSIAESNLQEIGNLRIIDLEDNEHGKKAAINYGINISNGELIVTTDADCIHSENWLTTIANYYESRKPKMIVAPVLMSSKNGFESMQALDFFSLMVSGAAAIGISQPIMCNGANLAFEKSIYLEMKDPLNKKQISGDDIFLLLNMKKQYHKGIHFLKSKEALVSTKAEQKFKDFITQRTRWTSKSKAYDDLFIIIVAVLVFLINLSLSANFLLIFILKERFLLFITQLSVKSIVDLILITKASTFFNKKNILKYFASVQIANIFLIPYIVFKGLFSQAKWR